MKIRKKCPCCEIDFHPKRSSQVFCAKTCDSEMRRRKWIGNKLRCGKPPGHSFPLGHTPWQKGTRGLVKPNSGSFQKGQRAANAAELGECRIYADKGTGTLRAYISIAPKKWIPRARMVYEKEHGPIGRGMIIHHINGIATDDRIENLQILSRAAHIRQHHAEILKARHR